MLVAWLEHRGGLFRHDADGRTMVALDSCPGRRLTLALRACHIEP
jgi:hypothetical protein